MCLSIMKFSNFKKILFGLTVIIVSFSSLTYLVKQRQYITKNIKQLMFSNGNILETKDKNKYWAKKILSGGFILFFRHAERDKWIDVAMYDALESQLLDKKNSNSFRFAENEYFANAVCLNQRGIIQAKAMREVIKYSKLQVGYVVSSPSCRARQTAELVFGGYDELEKKLYNIGPYAEFGNRPKFLENYILNLPRSKDKNLIISAHNGIVGFDLFPGDRSLQEGGFYVFSIKDNELFFEHEFHSFKLFSKHFFIRNHD